MNRRALGKGLSAIIPEEIRVVAATEAREIPIAAIHPSPFQPRINPQENLDDLVASIREHGVIQPVVVRRRPDGFELVVGERRLRAAQLAGLEKIPAVIRDVSQTKMLELALIENIQRSDLNPIEVALGYKRLADEFHLTHEEIAARVGKSRSAITNALRLLQLPQKVRTALSTGQISEGHARLLLTITDRTAQEELCSRIIQEGLSVRAVEQLTNRKRRPGLKSLSREPNLSALEEELGQHLGTRVRIRQHGSHGEIIISFADSSERERITTLLLGGMLRK